MRRVHVPPRRDWQSRVESQGLTFHSRPTAYWNEGVAYGFTEVEVDLLEAAGNVAHDLCMSAAERIMERGDYGRLGIDDGTAQLITDSWSRGDLHLFGRFDFAYDGGSPPKLLEYNADTPTSLLEASVIQWYWLEEAFPDLDQFNSIHERLINRWREMAIDRRVYFSALGDPENEEDIMTVEYLRDTAAQAEVDTEFIALEQVGYDPLKVAFTDLEFKEIGWLFKLYPWEWMVKERFGQYLARAQTRFIEPPWKMLLSNKALLPILWEMEPGHPNLLPAYETAERINGPWVRKPKLGREGANIRIEGGTTTVETEGDYGAEGWVYQAYHRLPVFEGQTPVLGLWIIGDECGGMGIRECDGPVTHNLSRFTPHFFE